MIEKIKKLDCEIEEYDERIKVNRDDFLSLKNKINLIIEEMNKRDK